MSIAHPQRQVLHDELHARPPEALEAPLSVWHCVMWTDAEARERSRTHLQALLALKGVQSVATEANFHRIRWGEVTLRWELHTEFVCWTFFLPLAEADVARLFGGEAPALALGLPEEWLSGLPGECVTRLCLWAVPRPRVGELVGARRVGTGRVGASGA